MKLRFSRSSAVFDFERVDFLPYGAEKSLSFSGMHGSVAKGRVKYLLYNSDERVKPRRTENRKQ